MNGNELYNKFKVNEMTENSGYKRELISTEFNEWRNRVERTYKYTWSDGSTDIKVVYQS